MKTRNILIFRIHFRNVCGTTFELITFSDVRFILNLFFFFIFLKGAE